MDALHPNGFEFLTEEQFKALTPREQWAYLNNTFSVLQRNAPQGDSADIQTLPPWSRIQFKQQPSR